MKMAKILSFLLFFVCFCTGAIGSPQILDINQSHDSIAALEKFELRLHIAAEYINPFDPAEIELSAVFTSPSGETWVIPGFYNYAHWRSLWMVRFSPNVVGKWHYEVTVRDQNGMDTSETRSFMVMKSSFMGPIRVSTNKRYLEYSDGTPFYGVGLWYNDGYTEFNNGSIQTAELDNLKSLGVNFISSFITPLETMGTGLGRYDQNICGRLDEVLEMCEEREIVLSLNIWFHSYLSETVWGGGNIRWHTNPYQNICHASDFYRSKLAWKYQEKLYRYMIARWGYSRSLAIWFIVDEVNGTDGWVSGDSLVAADWGRKVHEFFHKNDPFKHPTTGTRSGGITQFWHEGYQIFDIAAREIYEAQGFPIVKNGAVESAETHPLTLSYNNYADEIRKLWNGYPKPAIIGETGWDHTFYEPDMPGYLAQYHNALWVCLATGAAMTPFWWAHSSRMNDNVVSRQLRNFRRFTDQIPFSKLTEVAPCPASISDGDAFALSSEELIFGWAVNSNTDVVGKTVTLELPAPGKYSLKLYHTWRGQFIHEEEVNSVQEERSSNINGSGSAVGIQDLKVATNTLINRIQFSIPALYIEGSHANYIGQDIAFILKRMD